MTNLNRDKGTLYGHQRKSCCMPARHFQFAIPNETQPVVYRRCVCDTVSLKILEQRLVFLALTLEFAILYYVKKAAIEGLDRSVERKCSGAVSYSCAVSIFHFFFLVAQSSLERKTQNQIITP